MTIIGIIGTTTATRVNKNITELSTENKQQNKPGKNQIITTESIEIIIFTNKENTNQNSICIHNKRNIENNTIECNDTRYANKSFKENQIIPNIQTLPNFNNKEINENWNFDYMRINQKIQNVDSVDQLIWITMQATGCIHPTKESPNKIIKLTENLKKTAIQTTKWLIQALLKVTGCIFNINPTKATNFESYKPNYEYQDQLNKEIIPPSAPEPE